MMEILMYYSNSFIDAFYCQNTKITPMRVPKSFYGYD